MTDAAEAAVTPELLRAEGWREAPLYGFSRLIGGYWVRDEDGGRALGWLTEARHANKHGVAVHGGALMGFLDWSISNAALIASGASAVVTVQLDTQFVSAVKAGSFAEIRPTVLRKTRTLAFINGTVTVAGEPALHASGIWTWRTPSAEARPG